MLLALCAVNAAPLPRRTLLKGTAGALSLTPTSASAVGVRRFGAGGQSINSVADEQTKLVWTPRAEVRSRVVDDDGYSGYAYPPQFVTYLARILLNYDEGSAQWWAAQGAALPVYVDRATLTLLRSRQFGKFSESVKVGLRQFGQKKNDKGPRTLYSLLRARYGESRQAKLQLAILFSLLPPPSQPSGLVRQALGEFDNTTITALNMIDGGRGYTEPPTVRISSPDAQIYGAPAVARALMRPAGAIAQLRLLAPGGFYAQAPAVSITPPMAPGGRCARAKARVANGKVVELTITDGGAGYSARDAVSVNIDSPRDFGNELKVLVESGSLKTMSKRDLQATLEELNDSVNGAANKSSGGFAAATATAVLEQEVASIEVVDGGYGYAVDQVTYVEFVPADGQANSLGLGASSLNVTSAKAKVVLSPPAEESLLSFARNSAVQGSSYSVSGELLALLPPNCRPRRVLERKKGFYFKLVTTNENGRPTPAAAGLTDGILGSDRAFGTLGTTPVQRERTVGRRDYWALALSGAACTATIRTALLPVESTKVLMQVDAKQFPALVPSLRKIWATGGPAALFAGTDTSFLYAFVLGGVGFGANEFLRRYLSALAGASQPLYALQIQIAAGIGAAFVSVLLVCPLEVLRIRISQSVGERTMAVVAASAATATPVGGGEGGGTQSAIAESKVMTTTAVAVDPIPDVAAGLTALYAEGGLGLLYSALVPMLLRELPFTLCKFLVFDATTDLISSSLPALQEYGSVSALIAGIIAGVVAGLLTTPADTLVTRLSNARSRGEEASLLDTARSTLANDPKSLFTGLAPRCFLFGATIGGQYLLYDFWRRLFRVSADDLNLVLDVFADRVSFYTDYSGLM